MDARNILAKNASISKLDAASIEDLVRLATVQRMRRGEPVWRAGERAQSLVVVGHGLIKVLLPATGGRGMVLGLYGPGESVGDAQVLDGAANPTEACALTEPVTICRIPREALLSALERNGAAALEFARGMARGIAMASRRIGLFTASAEERLASTIVELGERFGDEMDDGSLMIPVRLTRAELAALVGTTPETTIRTLTRWSREGLVSTNDGALTVHDLGTLARRSVPPSPYNTLPVATLRA